jgi:hypothetical protein
MVRWFVVLHRLSRDGAGGVGAHPQFLAFILLAQFVRSEEIEIHQMQTICSLPNAAIRRQTVYVEALDLTGFKSYLKPLREKTEPSGEVRRPVFSGKTFSNRAQTLS